MMISALQKFQSAKPFHPYRLQLADGQDVDVTHPECLNYHPANPRTVGVAMEDGGIKVIDLLLVVAIEPSNGRASRRRRR